MVRKYIIELNRLQTLPHKWWKLGQDYQPVYDDVDVKIFLRDVEWGHWDVRVYKTHIEVLKSLNISGEVTPTPWDLMYAINTEIIEWKVATLLGKASQKTSPDTERADVAVFAALYIKTYFPEVDLYEALGTIEARRNTYFMIQPLVIGIDHPTDQRVLKDLLYMIAWGLCGGQVPAKTSYNRRRDDHVSSEADPT